MQDSINIIENTCKIIKKLLTERLCEKRNISRDESAISVS